MEWLVVTVDSCHERKETAIQMDGRLDKKKTQREANSSST
jgi:hypothetical protein